MLDSLYFPSLGSIGAIVVSTAALYAAILVIARASGVRSFAEMSPFDVVVTIAVGSLMAGVLAARNPPLVEGLTAVLTLYAILLMASGGRILHANLKVARVTEHDLRTHLRAANVADPARIKAVVMEGTGSISVLHGDDPNLARTAWVLDGVRDYSERQY